MSDRIETMRGKSRRTQARYTCALCDQRLDRAIAGQCGAIDPDTVADCNMAGWSMPTPPPAAPGHSEEGAKDAE